MPIRSATEADVPGIAAVMVASWDGTYRGLMPDSMIDRLDVAVRTAQWERYLADPPPRSALLVAEAGGTVVGMANAGPTRDADLDPAVTAELFAIYADPAHWGRGHGRQLMVATLGVMRAAGFESAGLWVLDTNTIGRSFYERGGWEADGSVKLDSSFGEPLREVRYRIDL